MIELIETLTLKNGTKDETKKLFSTKSVLIRLLKKSKLIPASLIFELAKNNKIEFLVGGLHREMKIVPVVEKEERRIISLEEARDSKPFAGLIL